MIQAEGIRDDTYPVALAYIYRQAQENRIDAMPEYADPKMGEKSHA